MKKGLILPFSLVLVSVILIFIKESQATSVEEDLTLSKKQSEILEIFKKNVWSKLNEGYPELATDIFLIRWLRAKNFNLKESEEMLRQHLKWRQESKVDTVVKDDWSKFNAEFPFYFDSFDKEGRPIMTMNLAEWDLRRGILSGQREKLNRWWNLAWERGAIKVRQLQKEGKKVTKWVLIIDITNFNIIQQACVQCLPLYLSQMLAYQSNYPGTVDKILIVNTPGIFEIVINVLRPFMNAEVSRILKFYGTNKSEWLPLLLKDIDPDQLPTSMGGTKPT